MIAPAWHALYEKYGISPQQSGGALEEDPFRLMAQQAHFAEQKGELTSTVAVLLSTASEDYSKQRYTVTLTCPCPSAEGTLSFTTEACFITGRRLLNEGAAAAGLPIL
jgi:hypothetical protein